MLSNIYVVKSTGRTNILIFGVCELGNFKVNFNYFGLDLLDIWKTHHAKFFFDVFTIVLVMYCTVKQADENHGGVLLYLGVSVVQFKKN